jgi:hypothetical protein
MTIPVSAGTHKVDLYWKCNAGTAQAHGAERNLVVQEK